MKTLTPEEILASELSCEIEDIGMAIFHNVQGYVLLKAIKVYHAQFHSHPSISAEEFLKEKGLYETTHDNLLCIGNKLVSLEDVKSLITDFASRQGKVVEPINDKGDKCSGCGHYFTDKYNFCPNCGSKIVWK